MSNIQICMHLSETDLQTVSAFSACWGFNLPQGGPAVCLHLRSEGSGLRSRSSGANWWFRPSSGEHQGAGNWQATGCQPQIHNPTHQGQGCECFLEIVLHEIILHFLGITLILKLCLRVQSTELSSRLSGLLERYQQYQDEVVSLHSWLSTQEQNQSIAKPSGETDPQHLQNTLRQVQVKHKHLNIYNK